MTGGGNGTGRAERERVYVLIIQKVSIQFFYNEINNDVYTVVVVQCYCAIQLYMPYSNLIKRRRIKWIFHLFMNLCNFLLFHLSQQGRERERDREGDLTVIFLLFRLNHRCRIWLCFIYFFLLVLAGRWRCRWLMNVL